MKTLWQATSDIAGFRPLEGNAETDVLIIGGGLTGILCAYRLKQAGVSCLLLEAGSICGGTTAGTTAKITSQHGLIYHRLIKRFDENTAGLYLHANEQAVREYRHMCAGIDCDFEDRDNLIYTLDRPDLVERELAALKALGYPAQRADSLPLPLPAAAVRFTGQAQFNPLKFAAAIAEGLDIRERTRVIKLDGRTALTDAGRIRAEKVIVATHFPFVNSHGMFFMKMYQHRSYVIALDNAARVDGMYADDGSGGLSFRNSGRLLLLGGAGGKTGAKNGGWKALREFAAQHFPDAKERYRWAAQDCMTLDGMPYIGRYGGADNLYVAAGYNKWGMTSAMVAAGLLCDLTQGRSNPLSRVFDPSRPMLIPPLLANAAKAAVNLLTPTTPRCPHMGCALKWNPTERTWDCPCHGSRFDERGRILDNPAKHPLERGKR